jgi:hypothetical protein
MSVYQESLMKGMFLGENQVMRGPSAAEGDVSLFRCLGESRETGNVSLSHCVRGRCPVSSLPHAAVLSHSVPVGVGRRARHGGARRGAEPLVSMAWLRHRAPRASLHGHPNESNAPCSQLSTPPAADAGRGDRVLAAELAAAGATAHPRYTRSTNIRYHAPTISPKQARVASLAEAEAGETPTTAQVTACLPRGGDGSWPRAPRGGDGVLTWPRRGAQTNVLLGDLDAALGAQAEAEAESRAEEA